MICTCKEPKGICRANEKKCSAATVVQLKCSSEETKIAPKNPIQVFIFLFKVVLWLY